MIDFTKTQLNIIPPDILSLQKANNVLEEKNTTLYYCLWVSIFIGASFYLYQSKINSQLKEKIKKHE